MLVSIHSSNSCFMDDSLLNCLFKIHGIVSTRSLIAELGLFIKVGFQVGS